MTAQVNLYHARFRKKHLHLSFKHMLIIAGISLLSIPALLIHDHRQRQEIAAYSTALIHEYQHMERKWRNIQGNLIAKTIDKNLTAEADKLKAIFDYRIELLKLINDNGYDPHKNLPAHTSYSDYMVALARQHLPSLWLTHIGIVKDGANLEIEGETLDAESVTAYLERLTREPALSGTKLRIFKIEGDNEKHAKPESSSGPLHFVIATSRDDL